jgi:hypothetical protein
MADHLGAPALFVNVNMEGHIYLRHSDLFGKRPHLATLKTKLSQFKLSDVIFTLSRINVLLGRQRMLREGSNNQRKLEELLRENYIWVDLTRALDDRPIFFRQSILNLQRLCILLCSEEATVVTKGKTPGGYELGSCCLMMNDHLVLPQAERRAGEGTDIKQRRHIGLQIAPMIELYNPPRVEQAVVRAETIFSEILNSPEMKAHIMQELNGFDIAKGFIEATGLSLDIYREMIISVVSSLLGRTYEELIEKPNLFMFRRHDFLKGSLVNQEEFNRYLSLDCINLREAKVLFNKTDQKLLKQFDYVKFRSRPLLELAGGTTVCADLSFLVEKLSSGIYWTIVDSLKVKDRGKALQGFGYLFEIYVNRLLAQIPALDGAFIPLPRYRTGEPSFDGILLRGNHLIALECKGGFMQIEAKYGGRVRAFEKDLDAKFGVNEGVVQLAKHIERLFRQPSSDRDQIEELNRLLRNSHSKIEKITPVLLVRESFLRFSAIEEMLSLRFIRLLAGKNVSRGVEVAPLAVIDIDTLEEMMPNLVEGDFTFEQCLNARALRDPGYRWMWYDFLLEYFPRFRKRNDENLNSKFGEIMHRGSRNFFGNATTGADSQ